MGLAKGRERKEGGTLARRSRSLLAARLLGSSRQRHEILWDDDEPPFGTRRRKGREGKGREGENGPVMDDLGARLDL